MSEYHLALLHLSETMDAVFESTKEPITCQKRCSSCCFEPVYVSQPEINLMLKAVDDGATPYTREELFAATEAWVKTFVSAGFLTQERVSAHDYRAAHVRCPLLFGKKDYRGTCGVYDVRPAGCRMHFTRGERTGCEDLEKRKDQKYIDVVGTAMQARPIADALINIAMKARDEQEGGGVASDHLGIMLAQALGIPCPDSAARVVTEFGDDDE